MQNSISGHPARSSSARAGMRKVGALAAIFAARSIYGKTPVAEDGKDMLEVNEQTADVFALANAKLYWDETYDRFIITPFNRFGRWLAERLDWAFWHDFVHERILKDAYNAVESYRLDDDDTRYSGSELVVRNLT